MNKPSKNSLKPIQKIWFKAKEYGWGWYPCSWQGWLIMAVYLVFFLSIMRYLVYQTTAEGITNGFVAIGISIIILLIVCYMKGEKPCWRWGINKNKGSNK